MKVGFIGLATGICHSDATACVATRRSVSIHTQSLPRLVGRPYRAKLWSGATRARRRPRSIIFCVSSCRALASPRASRRISRPRP